ncbi:SIMPL domain-containing protein [Luteimonas sp. SJ-92]|uniref:SIMPL domain-containing protein n=1 Tax=Luteimonas salinisoli TaxID=2752307 RepID=A0A853JFH1_9GAMM|nr:SIMPL domain-containing protein [Luteimonas salinisoli]NZA28066.1 SIMPL domain-containing protein [Luteimonas salinisoli]
MTRHALLPLLLAAALAAPAAVAVAQTPTGPQAAVTDGTLLSVSAQAEASRVPDVATLSAGVVTQAPDANAALRANAAQMQQLMAAVRKAGIAEKDTQTSGLNVHPQYRHDGDKAPTITGYQASNTVSLKVRDIGSLGDVLDALVASGANQVNGPSFEIDQPDEAYDEARRAALVKARERADMYAESLGLRVRRIVSISEGGGFMPPPRPMMRMQAEAMDMAASSPVSPGESTLTANLDVVFELGR